MSHSPELGGAIAQPASQTFTRTLGVGSIVFMVVAAAAPLTVVGGTVPLVFSMSESLAVPAYYLIAAVTLVIFAAGFTAMSRYVRNAGAFYSYIQAGLGKLSGIGAATLALFSYMVLLIAVYAYCGAAMTNAIAHYTGIETPWWLWTVVTLAIVALLGFRDIALSSKVLGALLIAEALVVIVLDVAIIAQGGAAGLSLLPFAPGQLATGNPGIGLMFAFFGFIGFEATAVFRNETKDPDRTIPKATYIAVISIGLFYALSAWAISMGSGLTGVIGASTDDPEGLVVAMSTQYVLPILGDLVQVLLVTSLFACVLSFHNVVTRYLYSLGTQRVLHPSLGDVHEKHNSPSLASATVTVVSAAALLAVMLLGLDPVTQIYAWLSGAATLGLMLLMAATSLAVLVYFARHVGAVESKLRTFVAPLVALLALLAVIALVLSNFPLLIGDSVTAVIMASAVVASFLVGVGLGARIRSKQPAVFTHLDESIASA